jgi:hypothetical protein
MSLIVDTCQPAKHFDVQIQVHYLQSKGSSGCPAYATPDAASRAKNPTSLLKVRRHDAILHTPHLITFHRKFGSFWDFMGLQGQ